jgi:hypothetical protein
MVSISLSILRWFLRMRGGQQGSDNVVGYNWPSFLPLERARPLCHWKELSTEMVGRLETGLFPPKWKGSDNVVGDNCPSFCSLERARPLCHWKELSTERVGRSEPGLFLLKWKGSDNVVGDIWPSFCSLERARPLCHWRCCQLRWSEDQNLVCFLQVARLWQCGWW